MKRFFSLVLIILVSLSFTSCLTIGFIDYMASQQEQEKIIKSNSGESYTNFNKSTIIKLI